MESWQKIDEKLTVDWRKLSANWYEASRSNALQNIGTVAASSATVIYETRSLLD